MLLHITRGRRGRETTAVLHIKRLTDRHAVLLGDGFNYRLALGRGDVLNLLYIALDQELLVEPQTLTVECMDKIGNSRRDVTLTRVKVSAGRITFSDGNTSVQTDLAEICNMLSLMEGEQEDIDADEAMIAEMEADA